MPAARYYVKSAVHHGGWKVSCKKAWDDETVENHQTICANYSNPRELYELTDDNTSVLLDSNILLVIMVLSLISLIYAVMKYNSKKENQE